MAATPLCWKKCRALSYWVLRMRNKFGIIHLIMLFYFGFTYSMLIIERIASRTNILSRLSDPPPPRETLSPALISSRFSSDLLKWTWSLAATEKVGNYMSVLIIICRVLPMKSQKFAWSLPSAGSNADLRLFSNLAAPYDAAVWLSTFGIRTPLPLHSGINIYHTAVPPGTTRSIVSKYRKPVN